MTNALLVRSEGFPSFDAVFLKLPPAFRTRVEAKINEIGSRLTTLESPAVARIRYGPIIG